MTKTKLVFLAIVVIGVAADLWTKHAAFAAIERNRGEIVVVEGFFHLYPMRNPGMAWSLLQGFDPRFWIIVRGILSLVLIAVYWTRPRMPWWANVAFAFVVAGALGNLYDNIFAKGGHVRDFVLLIFGGWRFPVFNIADSMITIGAPLLLLFFADAKPAKAAQPTPPSPPAQPDRPAQPGSPS
jgi:signal peptidase II